MYVLEIAKESPLAVEVFGQPLIRRARAVNDGSKWSSASKGGWPPAACVDHGSLYVTTGTVFGPDQGAVVRNEGWTAGTAMDDDRGNGDDDRGDDDHGRGGDHGGRASRRRSGRSRRRGDDGDMADHRTWADDDRARGGDRRRGGEAHRGESTDGDDDRTRRRGPLRAARTAGWAPASSTHGAHRAAIVAARGGRQPTTGCPCPDRGRSRLRLHAGPSPAARRRRPGRPRWRSDRRDCRDHAATGAACPAPRPSVSTASAWWWPAPATPVTRSPRLASSGASRPR